MSQQINLYQPQFRRQRKRFSVRHLPVAVLAMLLAFSAIYAYTAYRVRGLEALVREAARALEVQKQAVADLRARFPSQGPSKILEAEIARLDSELERRRQLLAALNTGELGNTEGFAEYFALLGRRDLPGVWLVGVTIADAGASLQVKGRALGAEMVPAYLKALSAEPRMQGRKVTELRLTAKSAAADKGAKPAVAPERFVEFAFTAPLAVSAPAGGGK